MFEKTGCFGHHHLVGVGLCPQNSSLVMLCHRITLA